LFYCSSPHKRNTTAIQVFKPPPPVGAGGGYMFSGRPSVPLSVRPSVIRVVLLFPQYLQHLLTDFRQTFVTSASWDTDDLIAFWGQKVKVQGHTIAAEAHSTRRYRRVQLFLVLQLLQVACKFSASCRKLVLQRCIAGVRTSAKYNCNTRKKFSYCSCIVAVLHLCGPL